MLRGIRRDPTAIAAIWAAITAVMVVSGVFVSPALAREAIPNIWAVSPANGAVIPASSVPVNFEINSTPLSKAYVTVAEHNRTNPDGTLIFENDFFPLSPVRLVEGNPPLQRGVSSIGAGWPAYPGTYYWQVESSAPDAFREYISPVYSLTISPSLPTASPAPAAPSPPKARPTLPEAYATVKQIITRHTGHRPRYLSDKCHLRGSAKVTCDAAWFSQSPVTSRTTEYAGTFSLGVPPTTSHFSFEGVRALNGCLDRFSVRHCASKVRWR
jgi:hypothetical protein